MTIPSNTLGQTVKRGKITCRGPHGEWPPMDIVSYFIGVSQVPGWLIPYHWWTPCTMNFTGSICPSPCGDWYPDPLWTVHPALKNSEATLRMLWLGKRSVCLDTTWCSVFIGINNGLFITQKGGVGGPLEDMEICGDKGGNQCRLCHDLGLQKVKSLPTENHRSGLICLWKTHGLVVAMPYSFIHLSIVCLSLYIFIYYMICSPLKFQSFL